MHAGDPLHWTGIDQTWNFQCAECHSTELRKNYDAQKNTYATTWAEIDVACEACHGPGSAHVAWAERQKSPLPWGKGGDNGLTVHFDERKDVSWTIDPATGNARRSTPRTSAKELETCGMCHSRSSKFAEPWRPGQPLLQTHLPSLLEPGLFEADGKSLDEVYNYAPFRQSKMFMAGVSCSDCHDPHSLKLVADGNAVCEQCHDGQKYAATSHHHHEDGSTGARCVACHMPARTYMIVDPRHDHAFRVPRPDESVRFGTSNACNDCHTDKDAAWAAAAVERWFGPERKGFQTWTETFAAARAGKVEAAALLLKLAASSDAPSIARATAFESLALHPSREALTAAERGLADADPLVRLAALRTLRPFPVQQSWPLASRLLADPVLGVRIEAASLLASVPQDRLSPDDRNRLSRAIDDYVTAQRVNADRPEHRLNLGNLYLQQGKMAEAEAEYEAARALDPGFTPVYVSLAQLYARQGRDVEGERTLREALTRMPDDAELHHALGLNLVRQRRTADALPELARAARSIRRTRVTPMSTRSRSTRGVAPTTRSRRSKRATPDIRPTATRSSRWSPSTAMPAATRPRSPGPTGWWWWTRRAARCATRSRGSPAFVRSSPLQTRRNSPGDRVWTKRMRSLACSNSAWSKGCTISSSGARLPTSCSFSPGRSSDL